MATAMISSDFGLRQFQQLNYCNTNPSESRTEVPASRSPNSTEEVSSGSGWEEYIFKVITPSLLYFFREITKQSHCR